MADASPIEGEIPPSASTRWRAIRQWVIDHDDSWLFIGAYITLAVVLSIWISLFWLVAVVAVHMAFEWVRQRHLDTRVPGVIARVLWETKLDIALVLFALVIGLYMEVILGIAGLSSATRAGLQTGARFAGWQRALRGVLLSVDDAAQLGRAVVRGQSNAEDGEDSDSGSQYPRAIWGGWIRRWSWGDRLSVSLGLVSLILILATPLLTDHDLQSTISTIGIELHPYPAATEDATVPAHILDNGAD
ncbi:MAG: hypothetical protein EA377_05330 [Phycisphaerales bacterium]|nr:MAG: hypothetical protein EA377_05330 [Phycisphaerales bacterium]